MKKILSLILVTASATSFADVSLYGRIAVGTENDSFNNPNIRTAGSVQDYGSYFGLHGIEDIGGIGNNQIQWQIENFIDLTAGQAYYNSTGSNQIGTDGPSTGGMYRVVRSVNTLASSDTYLGLKGDWGRFRAGNLSNYFRSDMGGYTDVYNYGGGVNGLANWSRLAAVLPDSIRYDAPLWKGLSGSIMYSFNNSGQLGTSGVGTTNNFGANLGGYYSGGVTSLGLGYAIGNFGINWTGQIWQGVGRYDAGNTSVAINSPSGTDNAYASRLELGYNDPKGLLAGAGVQISQGLGWAAWANSGGAYGVSINPNSINPAQGSNYNQLVNGLYSNSYQTQEMAFTMGYHVGQFVPKISYAYGANWMNGANLWEVMTATGNSIDGTGYQQLVAELDWLISQRTIAFVNFGQIWYGNTVQNIQFNGSQTTPNPNQNNTNNASYDNTQPGAFYSQTTVALGMSHTF